jgi:hypothetical protein
MFKLFKKRSNKSVVNNIEDLKDVEVLDKVEEVEEVEVGEVEEVKKVINSDHIQKDITLTFAKVLDEHNLTPTKLGEIEILKAKMGEYKDANSDIYQKIESLNLLGFTNTPTAKKSLKELQEKTKEFDIKIQNIQKEIDKSESIKNLTDTYLKKYPMYKFIDKDSMISIMKKYDLVLGDSFMYCKEIPDKALSIIENFSEEILESKEYNLIYFCSYWSDSGFYSSKYIVKKGKNLSSLLKKAEKDISNGDKLSESHPWKEHQIVGLVESTNLKMIAPQTHFNEIKELEYNGQKINFRTSILKLDEKTRMLSIDLNEVNKELEMIDILDPIACLKVEGGYIILDAWDEEADIPEIQNPMI